MGARQSKRSVDITTTPKKGDGDSPIIEGEGKVKEIGDVDAKVTTNGTLHTEVESTEQTNEEESTAKQNKDEDTVKENGVSETEEAKTPDAEPTAMGDQTNEGATTPEKSSDEKVEEASEKDKKKEKSKKKKWSFRSISFSKKDKSKPNKENDKNGEVKEVSEEVPVKARFSYRLPNEPLFRIDSAASQPAAVSMTTASTVYMVGTRNVDGSSYTHFTQLMQLGEDVRSPSKCDKHTLL
ncbi:hypothetical protein QE152_g36015 [Popillia japonica]|uniref:Uncharacterized protein n=1 Tax=Popillia japonica TaxID=7064 RepID=A0AAW1IEE4_POPJA